MQPLVHTLCSLVLCSLVVVPAAAQDKEEGFVPLFNGTSFAGWKTTDKTAKSWKVEDGLLVLMGGNNHLFTEQEFDNFIIRFQFRPKKKGYNSGFYIRGKNQINLAQRDAGRLFTSKETKAVPELHKEPGEWNEWEVTCDGSNVTLKVNGQQAWSINNFKPKAGVIGIQAEGQAIDFKNIRIKALN